MQSIAVFQIPDNPMPMPPRDPREQAVLYQHPSAPVIYEAYSTVESIAYAKAQADKERAMAQAAIDAADRCRGAGVPSQLIDLFQVHPEKIVDWFQVCVLELAGRKR